MTGDPVFTGPIQQLKNSVLCPSGVYTDFRFDCRVHYPQQIVDDGARYNVFLTFDGKTDPNNPDTHVITSGTALTVSFPSIATKGNLGKSVNVYLFCIGLPVYVLRVNTLPVNTCERYFNVTFYYRTTLLQCVIRQCCLSVTFMQCNVSKRLNIVKHFTRSEVLLL